jgi:hypothetical protein
MNAQASSSLRFIFDPIWLIGWILESVWKIKVNPQSVIALIYRYP